MEAADEEFLAVLVVGPRKDICESTYRHEHGGDEGEAEAQLGPYRPKDGGPLAAEGLDVDLLRLGLLIAGLP